MGTHNAASTMAISRIGLGLRARIVPEAARPAGTRLTDGYAADRLGLTPGWRPAVVLPCECGNLDFCRYALTYGSQGGFGCRPVWCGMLVDFELIKRAQPGDDAAFNEVVLAYRKRILGTIARLIARPEDVEDVGQEVFLRLVFLARSTPHGGGV